jgi:biopolymer transport protein ExbD
MTINATPEGKFYFQPVENASERVELLDKMGQKYGVTFDTNEKAAFQKLPAIGVPMNQLKSFLDLSEDEQKNYKNPAGIPMDSVNKQLTDWVQQSLSVNPSYKLAIKGDVNTQYPKVKSLFEGLRDIKFLNFWLITSQETKPTE